jgi:hypothetical protein
MSNPGRSAAGMRMVRAADIAPARRDQDRRYLLRRYLHGHRDGLSADRLYAFLSRPATRTLGPVQSKHVTSRSLRYSRGSSSSADSMAASPCRAGATRLPRAAAPRNSGSAADPRSRRPGRVGCKVGADVAAAQKIVERTRQVIVERPVLNQVWAVGIPPTGWGSCGAILGRTIGAWSNA